ncbi:MAG TPA: ComEC/Rec2 family competence protein [Terriglobia bacterium]|nr:ComEC/Rec2 family competence protein [Terriglobia bacterium]
MAPLVFPLLVLAAGILCSPCLDPTSLWIALPLSAVIACARPRLALLTLFIAGAALRALLPDAPPDPGPVAVRLVGTLERRPEWRGPGVYLNVRVLSIDGKEAAGRARLTEFLEEPELIRIFNALDLGRGDRVEILVKLARPPVYRNPGVFDYRRYLERQGVFWTGNVRNPRLITVVSRGWHAPDDVRAWIERRLERRFGNNPDVAGLVAGLTLGRKDAVTPEVEETFKMSGVYHLVVVSGFHFAVVLAAAGWLSRWVTRRRAWRFGVTLAAGLAYALLVEGQTPALRALIMATFIMLSTAMDRGYSPLNAVAASAFVILIWDPSALEDPSFQMTFTAVLAVILLGAPAARWAVERWKARLDGFTDEARDSLLPVEVADWRVSRRLWLELHGLPAWTVTVPWRLVIYGSEGLIVAAAVESVFAVFMVESFHRLAPLSALVNVPAGLVAAFGTCAALATIVLPDAIAWPVVWCAEMLFSGLIRILQASLAIPGATIRVPSAPVWLWAVYGAALVLLFWSVWKRRPFPAVLAGCGVAGTLAVIALADFSPPAPSALTMTVLDVGQGDSILLEFPDGRRMLVDGGGVAAGRFLGLRDDRGFSIGEDVVSAYLFSRRIRRLDAVVLTHAHNDHLDGLFEVVENFKVGEAWLGPNAMTPRYRAFLLRLSMKSIPARWVFAGQATGDIEVLHPPRGWKVRKTARNNDSVVLLVHAGTRTALLTGDLESGLAGAPERVSVLKVPHHGSGGVQLRVAADVRLISVGANNPFGHPASSALPAVRTDQVGAITVRFGPDAVDSHELIEVSSALTRHCPSCKLPGLGFWPL